MDQIDKSLYWSKMEDEHQKGQSDDSTSDGEENYSEKRIIKMYLWKYKSNFQYALTEIKDTFI